MTWIRLDAGLLGDEDFDALSAAARGAWVTAYLLQKRREGRPFKNHAELCRLLRKEGIDNPDVLVAEMRAMLVGPDLDGPDGEVGVKGYEEYQRDPTSADRQRRYRDRLRALRNETVTSHDGTGRDIHTPRSHTRVLERIDPKQALINAGVDPDLISKGKDRKRGVEPSE